MIRLRESSSQNNSANSLSQTLDNKLTALELSLRIIEAIGVEDVNSESLLKPIPAKEDKLLESVLHAIEQQGINISAQALTSYRALLDMVLAEWAREIITQPLSLLNLDVDNPKKYNLASMAVAMLPLHDLLDVLCEFLSYYRQQLVDNVISKNDLQRMRKIINILVQDSNIRLQNIQKPGAAEHIDFEVYSRVMETLSQLNAAISSRVKSKIASLKN